MLLDSNRRTVSVNVLPKMLLTEYMMQNDAGWVPSVFSPIMFQGNPELWNGTAGAISTGAETFPPGVIPLGAFPPGIIPTGTDGMTIPQCIPVLFPVQMPLFLPSPTSNQSGQNAGFYPFSPMVPFYGLPGMAAGAPAGLKFPIPMYVLNTYRFSLNLLLVYLLPSVYLL